MNRGRGGGDGSSNRGRGGGRGGGGGGGRGRGGGGGGGRGGYNQRGGHQQAQQQQQQQQQRDNKREPILDLTKYLNKLVNVKFIGNREVNGILKGFDPLLNLVLDTTTETMNIDDSTRQLGLVVCRGTAVILICPADGKEQIANPFLTAE